MSRPFVISNTLRRYGLKRASSADLRRRLDSWLESPDEYFHAFKEAWELYDRAERGLQKYAEALCLYRSCEMELLARVAPEHCSEVLDKRLALQRQPKFDLSAAMHHLSPRSHRNPIALLHARKLAWELQENDEGDVESTSSEHSQTEDS